MELCNLLEPMHLDNKIINSCAKHVKFTSMIEVTFIKLNLQMIIQSLQIIKSPYHYYKEKFNRKNKELLG